MTIANPSTTDDLGSAAQRERRKRILDATYELAKSGGFDAVQMRAVAEHADVALGTLYRYFPSKIHLLVSALGRQFDEAATRLNEREIPGDNQADRVLYVLKRMARGMQGDPKLTEALTRAFMFADSSVAAEIHVVGMAMTSIVTHAMHGGAPSEGAVSDEDVAVARVIGDVWLSALVSWVTGRSTAAETAAHMETAIHLILRD
ncbi:TetR family transcriptional regulator [Pimelobacter simplex]|uniref:Transcriptional regulator, TetR family n=1 Tax=Nocardioides simplex TaxID=2045 RepID=A0A0A1DIW9_NOCSI|nr:TetR family transcriptional regulator [Pimelobacter simplex]AIY17336.1 Transcriptional regulator, TetR family kstR [Pimelobacter simplex]GEB13390.1 TetR family transcriptional regulator [Pimelobacter simplex]SFM45413.1 transcriptional regulator, TetR family [Pimelobacter simplex]